MLPGFYETYPFLLLKNTLSEKSKDFSDKDTCLKRHAKRRTPRHYITPFSLKNGTLNLFRAVRILNAGFNDNNIFIALLIKEFLNSK
jgi:hypothetical protein